MMVFFFKLANKTLHEGWFPGTFPKCFRLAISKNTPLTAASEITVVTVFVLRSSRSEVVHNYSEKSEKTLRKKFVEVYCFNFS